MDNKKIERMTVDGRRAEVHIVEQPLEGATHRITEHFEEIIPFEKTKKVTERILPVVVERVTEQYNGNQVNKVVERVAHDDPSHRLCLVPETHPVTAKEVETILRQLVHEESSQHGGMSNVFKWIGDKMPHPPVSPPSPDPPVPIPPGPVAAIPLPPPSPSPLAGQSNVIIAYALITLLAIEVGFLVWQLFIR